MSDSAILKDNYLTQKPKGSAFLLTAYLGAFLWVLSFSYLTNYALAVQFLPATAKQVFTDHQYWRLWTTLFTHADIAHLLSNWLLFLPLAYLLNGYFGTLFFPIGGIFVGGLINIVVLKTLGPQTQLIGMSGVVYWMGAAWLTLYYLIDKRKTPLRRFAVAFGIALVLFAPETYKPEISYLSHFLGFIFGSASALLYYVIHRQKFLDAEVYVPVEIESEAEELFKFS